MKKKTYHDDVLDGTARNRKRSTSTKKKTKAGKLTTKVRQALDKVFSRSSDTAEAAKSTTRRKRASVTAKKTVKPKVKARAKAKAPAKKTTTKPRGKSKSATKVVAKSTWQKIHDRTEAIMKKSGVKAKKTITTYNTPRSVASKMAFKEVMGK